MFTLGHVSDWHTTSLEDAGVADLFNKRFFGWLSWNIRRRRLHQQSVLDALFEDLRDQQPDHVAVTGDLTNVALEQEFQNAAELLGRLGTADWISLVPGNHDSYVGVPVERSWDLWREYIRSDSQAGKAEPLSFPTLRVRDGVALVGVCSARPTPFFQATGKVGAQQRERLEQLLGELRDRDLCRVVLIHHPLTHRGISPRRWLSDGPEIEALLKRVGADLVLHGHRHRTMIDYIPGPDGEIPIVGVRSASDVGEEPEKCAQYHLYRIEPCGGGKHRISLIQRGYDPASGRFVGASERQL